MKLVGVKIGDIITNCWSLNCRYSSMDNSTVLIKDVRQGMKNLIMTVIVLDVGPPVQVKEREVRTLKVADATACINLSLWGEAGNHIVPGDIIRLSKAHVNVYRNCITLLNSKNCEIDKIGEFCMVFNEQLNMSEPNLELAACSGNKGRGGPPIAMFPGVSGVGPQQLGGKPRPPPPPQASAGDQHNLSKRPKMNRSNSRNKPPRVRASGGGAEANLPRPDRR